MNRMSGAGGADTFASGPVFDEMLGGAGVDTVDYSASTVPLDLRLGEPTVYSEGTGDGQDFILDVENAVGGPHSDVVTGNSGPNGLSGGSGNDELTGEGGVDRFSGGPGDDFVDSFDDAAGALAAEQIDCGPGRDLVFGDDREGLGPTCEVVAPTIVGELGIAGSPVEGSLLGADTSRLTVLGTPSTRRFGWLRCDGSLAGCELVGGAAGPTYVPGPGDVGRRMIVGMEEENEAGGDAVVSGPTAAVSARPPAPIVLSPPPPVVETLMARVSSARCRRKACRVTVVLGGPVRQLRLQLRRGRRVLITRTRRVSAGRRTVTLRLRRRLRRGRHTLAIRVTAHDGRRMTLRRTVRVRR
jgi:hypothetical protein